jgi:ureidoglycolate lyase
MRTIVAGPLTAEAFKPFGAVLEGPPTAGRVFVSETLASARAHAPVCLSVATVEPKKELPLQVKVLERHEHSSQTFVPLSVSRYLVLATLDAPGGGPDLTRLRAFVARAGQGVTYAMGTWHHPVTVLDTPASFAVLMWRDGTSGDEEFVPVTTPLTVVVP